VTIGEALAETAARLAAAGLADCRAEARRLTALALGVDAAFVLGYPERSMPPAARERLCDLTTRRARHEPFSRLRGMREFWSLNFALSPETLDPRPDSETLIEAAIETLPADRLLKIVDFGTGSGCLLLALLSELPLAWGLGIDLSPGAVATARRNAAALGLAERARFAAADWGEALGGTVDVILANPPYIPGDEIRSLAPEVAEYDPRLALDGGADGLAAYRRLAPAAERLLKPTGYGFFEFGAGQAAAVAEIMAGVGLAVSDTRRDLAGIERCLIVTAA
jgi:release factor glutamine methyltransferase